MEKPNWKLFKQGALKYYSCVNIFPKKAFNIENKSTDEVVDILNKEEQSFLSRDLPDRIAYKIDPEYNEDYLLRLPAGVYSVEESPDYEMVLSPRIIEKREYKYYPQISKQFFETLNKFLEKEEKYKENNWKFKLGCLLYGPPGESKTSSLNYAIHNILPKDSVIILCRGAKIPTSQIIETINRTNKDSLVVLIFEEIVTILDASNNNLPLILDMLDGESSFNRFIAIATTNHPENLPKNLSNRRGRFDRLFNFKQPIKSEVKIILESILNREPTENEVNSCTGFSISDIKASVEYSLMENTTIEASAKFLKDLAKTAEKDFMDEKKIGF